MTLKESMAADTASFFDVDEFAESAVFSRTGETVSILIDKEMEPDTGRFVEYITVKLSDAANATVGDTFTVGTDVYYVTSSAPERIDALLGMLRVER